MESEISIAIVAADPLVRMGLSQMLDGVSNLHVVEASDPAILIGPPDHDHALPEVDIIIWDHGQETGLLEGVDFNFYEPPFLLLVTNEQQAVEAWHAGAQAILARQFAPQDIVSAISAVLHGLIVLDPRLTGSLLPSPPRHAADVVHDPTPRELEVLQLLAEGLTNKAIAARLQISEHTVKFHVNAILKKLNAQSRTEAVVTATRLGFIAL